MDFRPATALLLLAGLFLAGCAAHRAAAVQPDVDSSIASDMPSTAYLLGQAYALARARADSSALSTILADAIADQARALTIAGYDDEAVSLWTEALAQLTADSTRTPLGAPPDSLRRGR